MGDARRRRLAALSLILVPVVFGWRAAFARVPGKLGTIVYFACLGLGYIMVEVGLISRFTLALSNPTISASVLISGMLVFSGLGSLVSERIADRARAILPLILVGIAALLVTYAFALAPVLDWIGGLAYPLRLLLSVAVVAPPAFLMGFPMATGMGWLARLDKEHMFVWAWGINGCFSVVGAAAMPIIATGFGLSMVLEVSGVAYLLAIPAFFALLRRPPSPPRGWRSHERRALEDRLSRSLAIGHASACCRRAICHGRPTQALPMTPLSHTISAAGALHELRLSL